MLYLLYIKYGSVELEVYLDFWKCTKLCDENIGLQNSKMLAVNWDERR